MVRRPIRMTRVEVRGGAKWFTRASKRSPMKLSGGPGRTGRILPAIPRRIRIDPKMITMISSMRSVPKKCDSLNELLSFPRALSLHPLVYRCYALVGPANQEHSNDIPGGGG